MQLKNDRKNLIRIWLGWGFLLVLSLAGSAYASEEWQELKRALTAGREAIAQGDASLLGEILAPFELSAHQTRELCSKAVTHDCFDCLTTLVSDDLERCGKLENMAERAVRIDSRRVLDELIARGVPLDEMTGAVIDTENSDLARRILEALWGSTKDSASADTAGWDPAGWNPEGRDSAGDTHLTRTLKRKGGRAYEETLLLLVAGADPGSTDADGHTPLELAAARGRPDLVWALRAHGAPVSPDTTALANQLWESYEHEPSVYFEYNGAPRRIDLEVPQGLAFGQFESTDPVAQRLLGDCCFGFRIEIFVKPPVSRLGRVTSRVWHAIQPPTVQPIRRSPFSPPRWAGLSLRGPREPSESVFVSGFRSCYPVEVNVSGPISLLPEAEALARRLFEGVRPSPCSIHVLDLGALALAATLFVALGLRARTRRRRRGEQDTSLDFEDLQP